MRLALALFLLLHGLAHLAGFLTPWGIAPQPTERTNSPRTNVLFGGRVTLGAAAWRALGIAWLAVALAFAVVAFGFWQRATWSLGALVGVSLISLVLTLVWWPLARIGAAINLTLLARLVGIGVLQFRDEMNDARSRVRTGSTVLRTAVGNIEYGTLGEGAPILALHGTAGGWDQAITAGSEITRYGYRLIAPSRFGYLRTPKRDDASPSLEADTWAMLLDSLAIDRVAVISWSAGAAPAVQFALRHPERVSKLVFFVPGAGGLAPPAPGPPRWLVGAIFKFNFPIWAAQHLAPKTMLSWVAVPASLVPSLRPSDRAVLESTVESLFPVDARHDGMLYDARSQAGGFGLFPIQAITAPTLWISAEDDLYRTIRVARHGAAAVPGARLLTFETGGHLLLGRGPELWPQVAEFLRDGR